MVRTVNHDNFGLAVLIFHLLFMGRHPFAGRYSGSGEMPIEKAIRDYRFAYGSSASRLQMAPPPNSLTLSALPPGIGALFERAFTKGSEHPNGRPTAHTWASALEQFERQLCQCQQDPGHHYPTQLKACPWCEVIRSGGPNFFISVSIQAVVARSASFDFTRIWHEIQSVPRPNQVFTPAQRLPASSIAMSPIPATADPNRVVRNTIGIIGGAAGLLTLVGLPFPPIALFTLPIFIVFAIWWLVLKAHSPIGRMKSERRTLYWNKKRELERAQANLRAIAQKHVEQFDSKLKSLFQIKRTYDQLKTERDSELQSLHQQVQQRQLDEYLRQCFISNAGISGIGPARIAALESYGIETAYDISRSRVLNVPGFGEKMTDKLVNWRYEKKQAFRFNPSKGIPQVDLQTVEMKYAQKRAQCELAFQHGPHELRQVLNSAKTEFERIDGIVARLENETAQSKANLSAFDRIPWWY